MDIKIMNFKNSNIGYIYYQSSKWLLYSFISTEGTFDGFTLQQILPTDKLDIIESDNYLKTVEKYIKNARKLGFYDPFEKENLLSDFEVLNLTDKNICQKLIKLYHEKEQFCQNNSL